MTAPSPAPAPGPAPRREEFERALCEFINGQLPALHPKMRRDPAVKSDTLLFDTGLIDSMAILHLIAYIETATGREIPTEKVVMKHFRTVSAIAETFWPGPAP